MKILKSFSGSFRILRTFPFESCVNNLEDKVGLHIYPIFSVAIEVRTSRHPDKPELTLLALATCVWTAAEFAALASLSVTPVDID